MQQPAKEKSRSNIISQPLFSVVIATFNRAELLKRALESLIRQTEKEWEAIIVDDGSTDDTHEQILPYLESFGGMKYFHKPHSGMVTSKNQGIALAGGKFITFLDSDDEYLPSHLEGRRRFLEDNPEVMFLYGGAKILGNPYVPDKNDPSARIHLSDCVIGGTFVVEREVLLSLGGFQQITLSCDFDLWKRAKKRKITMAEIKTPTYIYHHENPDSVTNRLFGNVKFP